MFYNISKGSKYGGLASWGKAVVVQYPAKECQNARGFGYHHCNPKVKKGEFGACRVATDPTRVKIHRLDRNGEKQTGVWAQETINNTRTKVLTFEEGQPIMDDLAQRYIERDQAFKVRSARNSAQYRIDKAAIPMVKALKRIARGRFTSAPEAASIAAEVLELVKAPPKKEEEG